MIASSPIVMIFVPVSRLPFDSDGLALNRFRIPVTVRSLLEVTPISLLMVRLGIVFKTNPPSEIVWSSSLSKITVDPWTVASSCPPLVRYKSPRSVNCLPFTTNL